MHRDLAGWIGVVEKEMQRICRDLQGLGTSGVELKSCPKPKP